MVFLLFDPVTCFMIYSISHPLIAWITHWVSNLLNGEIIKLNEYEIFFRVEYLINLLDCLFFEMSNWLPNFNKLFILLKELSFVAG